jgi:hypothetical protein
MATKKRSTKKGGKGKGKPGLAEDPPVVVGGGNSVDITFNSDAIGLSNPPAGRMKFRQPGNVTLVIINDGTHPAPQLIRVSGAFTVSFF